jgi:hypothetical protein
MDSVSEGKLSAVDDELARRVRAMADDLSAQGIEIVVRSGKRSLEQQQKLYANRGSNPYPVAVPGTSRHERGLAVDVVPVGARSSDIWQAIGEAGELQGLRWGGRFNHSDPPHFELPDGAVSTSVESGASSNKSDYSDTSNSSSSLDTVNTDYSSYTDYAGSLTGYDDSGASAESNSSGSVLMLAAAVLAAVFIYERSR